MIPTATRRRFLTGMTVAPLAAGAAPASSPDKMYTWLTCATLGIRANQQRALELAARHGFQAIEPMTEEIAAMPDDNLKQLVDNMRAKNLRWGTATMRLGFNVGETEFSAGVALGLNRGFRKGARFMTSKSRTK